MFSDHDSVDDMLDAKNKRLAENLATKVSRLKSVSQTRTFLQIPEDDVLLFLYL